MKICEVINSIVYSFSKESSGKMNSFPYIKNLLGIKKTEKEKAIKQAYEDFIHFRKETIVLTSISTSSKLFTFVLTHTPRIHFWMKRVYSEENKRYDLIVLYFCNLKLV